MRGRAANLLHLRLPQALPWRFPGRPPVGAESSVLHARFLRGTMRFPARARIRTVVSATRDDSIDSVIGTRPDNARDFMAEAGERRIGVDENERYDCSDSVSTWSFHSPELSARKAADQLRTRPEEAVPYYAYHGFRSTALATQGAMGVLLAAMVANLSGGPTQGSGAVFLNGLLPTVGERVGNLGRECLGSFAADFECISQGEYKAPWDMSPTHRQLRPSYIAEKSSKFLREAAAVLVRRGKANELGVADTTTWLDSPLFPKYYGDTHHFQTDGWVSRRSAEVYDISTETLFLGRQDAMQRISLIPMHSWRKESGKDTSDGENLKVAELACGTGRFSTFVRDNMRAADFSLVDMSPFYLEAARENQQYYRSFIGADKLTGNVKYVLAQAENTGLPSDSYDIVYCVYTFHELPEEARAAVAKEMVRIARPGGVIILTDSGQLGDRPEFDSSIGNFYYFNEPFYDTFVQDDLGAYFEAAGAKPYQKHQRSVTKSLSFIKAEV